MSLRALWRFVAVVQLKAQGICTATNVFHLNDPAAADVEGHHVSRQTGAKAR